MIVTVQCNSCKASFDTTPELQQHVRDSRKVEADLSWTNPRDRIMMAMIGIDHSVVLPEVSRRAFRRRMPIL